MRTKIQKVFDFLESFNLWYVSQIKDKNQLNYPQFIIIPNLLYINIFIIFERVIWMIDS